MDNKILAVMSSKLNDNLNFTDSTKTNFAAHANYVGDFPSHQANTMLKSWDWWTDTYYPKVIRESYPVYIQERAQDKGKQAFEIIKVLKDKKLMKLDTVGDFIECMDALIKIL
jgi:hypothetical protein